MSPGRLCTAHRQTHGCKQGRAKPAAKRLAKGCFDKVGAWRVRAWLKGVEQMLEVKKA